MAKDKTVNKRMAKCRQSEKEEGLERLELSIFTDQIERLNRLAKKRGYNQPRQLKQGMRAVIGSLLSAHEDDIAPPGNNMTNRYRDLAKRAEYLRANKFTDPQIAYRWNEQRRLPFLPGRTTWNAQSIRTLVERYGSDSY